MDEAIYIDHIFSDARKESYTMHVYVYDRLTS